MRVTLVLDGKERVVDVDPSDGTATVDGRRFSVTVLRTTPTGVELEIDGERAMVDGWPEGLDTPLPALSVNGERVDLRIASRSDVGAGASSARPTPAPTAPVASGPAPPAPTGPGSAVLPPMPGKVLEVRVREGEAVRAGQVLLVVEAMKMRNEIVAPADGVVRDLRVASGANVPARFVMLRVEPA